MTTYTVINQFSGDVIARGQTAIQAMDLILTHDGYAYEIRPATDGYGWELWCSNGSRNSYGGLCGFSKTRVFSLTADEQDAAQEIAEAVIHAGWPRLPVAMTDADYDQMLTDTGGENTT